MQNLNQEIEDTIKKIQRQSRRSLDRKSDVRASKQSRSSFNDKVNEKLEKNDQML